MELQAALDTKTLADSNLYSVAETILLRWVNFHYTKEVRGWSARSLAGTVPAFVLIL